MPNLAYQDEVSTEMLDCKIVAMSPRPAVNHNIVAFNIARIFADFLDGKACTVFSDGIDVYLTQRDRVIPDVMIVCNKNIIKKNGVHGVPDLIVEVLSPSTTKRDRGYKKDLYESCGVKEYWLVDADNRSIEVYLLKANKYELNEVYLIFPDYLVENMTDAEKDSIIHEFKTSLYPDMMIVLEKVFAGIF